MKARQTTIAQQTIKIELFDEGNPLTISEVIDRWSGDKTFRTFYNSILADCPYKSFFWEHPPLTSASTDRPYEFVLIKSNILQGVRSEPITFKQYFKKDEAVVVFPNLGGDALLIVPNPEGNNAFYTDLAPFTRHAPQEQVDALWETTGTQYRKAIGEDPKWLSTAGLGVYWLHLRIDTIPKYYRHTEYKTADT